MTQKENPVLWDLLYYRTISPVGRRSTDVFPPPHIFIAQSIFNELNAAPALHTNLHTLI